MMFSLVLFILNLINFSGTADYCPKNEDQSCRETQSNLYKKEMSAFIRDLRKAENAFKPEDVNCFNSTIHNDLIPFKNGITKEMLESSLSKGVKYQLIDHVLYRTKDCMFPSRCSGVEYFINRLKNELPDFECVINFHDWPQVNKHFGARLPVFSFSKTEDYFDIMYPAWSFWEGGPAIKLYPRGIGRWDVGRKKVLAAGEKYPWEEKKSVFFFRGSRTSSERDTLILLSRKIPQLVNASYTKNQAWKSEKDTLGFPPAEEVSFEDHCEYRYLLNFRGVAASFRFKYLFLCKSLVLHVGDEWKEFFYDHMKPWIHYIPISTEASENDYRMLIDFIIQEDRIVKKIAQEGYNFVSNNLRMKDIFCYWKNLLIQYSGLLKFKPKLDKTLIKV